jgi:PAS domain S-box-containing protein
MSMQEAAFAPTAAAFARIPGVLKAPPDFIEKLPLAIYACDAAGRIRWFNSKAAELWGRAPRLHDDTEQFCGSYKLYLDGRAIARAETPMAAVLRTGEAVRGVEARVERPDGSSVWATVHIEPIEDEDGVVVGAINCFHDTTAQHETAEELRAVQAALSCRIEQQAALHRMTERLRHAASVSDAYEAALDAIVSALGCRRASILLFDGSPVMKFVAWRELSDAYRRAVEGHSPWTPEAKDPKPICIDDVASADLPADLKRSVLAEGIAAVAFVPLQEKGRLVGKFMAYYDAPHSFSYHEIDLAVTIARQLAFAIERMRASRAALQLAAIVESSDDAIISKDLDGIIRTWNAGAERVFGYMAEEVIGKPVTVLMPPDRVNEEPGILARLRRGERIDHYETVRRRKDGSLIDISLTVSPIRDGSGKVIGASKIARDISQRKAAEAQLRESEQRLQDLLAAIPAAIYTTDAQGRITYFNEAAVEFAGQRPTIGSDEWCVTWKLYWPDGTFLPHDQCPMAIALKEGRAVRGVEAVAERPDGTRVPFIPYPTPLRDGNGRVVGAINMLVDVSERKEAETQQRVLLRELNHRVKNNMQMLQSVLFVAGRKSNSDEARNILAEASSRVSAMAAAQRVLYGTTNATRFDPKEMILSVCKTLQQTFPPGIEIACDAASADLPNDAAMPLALILNELLTNAVKHGLRQEPGAIRVCFDTDGDCFVLRVEDDGPGFDLEPALQRSSGLELVRGLARQLRGELTVTRHPVACCAVRFTNGGV